MKLKYQWVAGALAVTIGWWASANNVLAADLPTFKLEMNDGKLNPARIEVPAGQRIKIEVHNIGKGARCRFLRRDRSAGPGRIQVLR
jgi:Cupredoxin-like domain